MPLRTSTVLPYCCKALAKLATQFRLHSRISQSPRRAMQRAAPAAVSAPSQRPAQPVPSIRGYLNRSHLPAAFQSAIQPGQRQASTAAPQPQAAGRSGPPGSSGQQQPPPAHVDQQQQQREAAAPDRRPAQLAAVAGLAAIGAACYATLSAQPELPPLDAVLGPAAAVLLGGPALALLLAKAVLRDRLQVELHRGRLYLSAGMPLSGLPLAPGAVAVRPTGDVRGNGAYATALIPAGTYLGDYTGEVLDRRAFFSRHPDGVVSGCCDGVSGRAVRAWVGW